LPGNTLDTIRKQQLQEGSLLASRLERLSADSHWARRASGLRGALLRCLELLGQPGLQSEFSEIEIERAWLALPGLLDRGQSILFQAARLIRTPDTQFD
jgi:hypothetical protein